VHAVLENDSTFPAARRGDAQGFVTLTERVVG